jgi:hypothetical protein
MFGGISSDKVVTGDTGTGTARVEADPKVSAGIDAALGAKDAVVVNKAPETYAKPGEVAKAPDTPAPELSGSTKASTVSVSISSSSKPALPKITPEYGEGMNADKAGKLLGGLDPVKFASSLVASVPGADAGKVEVTFEKHRYHADRLVISITGPGFTAESPLELHAMPGHKKLHIEDAEVSKDAQSQGVMKNYMKGILATVEGASSVFNRISLVANIDVGSYAWARYGFCPQSPAELRSIVRNAEKRANELVTSGDAETRALGEQALKVLDSGGDHLGERLWDISALSKKLPESGEKLGYYLLESKEWNGELRLDDDKAVKTMKAYLGGSGASTGTPAKTESA